MKKMKHFAYAGAIALLSVVGFTACSSSDGVAEVVEPSPNYNPETNEVYTQLVFNVASGSSDMRQTSVATQASSDLGAEEFRGIDNTHIMCFIQSGADGKFLSEPTTAAKDYDMARVAAAGTLSNSNSRRVLEMSLPLNTNTMLFYGKAINAINTVAGYNTYGHLDAYTITDNLANVNFQLGRRLTTDDKTKFKEIQKLLATVLTCIINTNRGAYEVAATASPGEGVSAYGYAITASDVPNMPWSSYNSSKSPFNSSKDITPLEQKLGNAYKEMTTIQEKELRNASGYALKMTIQDLWSIVNAVRCATPTSKEEAIAKYMAHLISQHLSKYFSYTTLPTDGGSVTGVAFLGATDIIDAIEKDPYWPSATPGDKPTKDNDFSHVSTTSSADLGKFPEQFNLPQGSTHIKYDQASRKFDYVENYNTSAVGGDKFTVDDYYYPAELCYFGNSPIRVSDKEHVVMDYPESVTKWDTESNWASSDWATTHVQSSTRSVAMKNDINYGSSLLKTTVRYDAAVLKDNNKAIQQRDYGVVEEDKEITVNGTSFKLVGIIVGGQWPNVGWNYLPKTSGGDSYRQGYVFDVDITNNGVIPVTGTSEPNYTLVFDNYVNRYHATENPNNNQDKVYIALEFENNSGVDFFGKDNLIHNGGHFYLIGELDPTGKTAPTWPTHHALPPYDRDAVARVFIQDYMTTANFKIGANSLKYAYLTVPDLRSSSVTLGLSVDVKWETGLLFDNIILGGN